ncbi:MAG: HAMP domain-containing histidine kinase [Acidobacteria bacterium]|nr:MAG: HAMP domain-containing histidine kinase [Acidobacteriota bacterium]
MARASRPQIVIGAMFMLALFLIAVYISGRASFREQMDRFADSSRIAATSAILAAGDPPRLDTIDRVAAAMPVPDDGAVFLLDVAERKIIKAHGPQALISATTFETVPPDGRHEDPDGTGRAYGSAVDPTGRWKLVIGLPRRLAWETLTPMFERNVFNAGWWYLLSVGALWWFVSRWLKSVRTLEQIAARVTAGDLSTPPLQPMASRELDAMQQSMVDMITRVRELQRQVVRQERLAAIGVLVSGVAHEINNPLQAILGFSQVMSARPDLPAEARADLAVIQRESERAGTIIRNLSRFTRQQPAGPTSIRLTDTVSWLSEMWRRRFEENAILFELSDRSTKTAHAVATEIQQVALNFLTNAEYAVLNNPSRNAVRHIVLRTLDTPDGRVRLEVEDSGPGVSPEHEANLFQPFFTTKPVGEGTGLGLSVSYGIIQSHGGAIGHDAGSLGGARFYFEIPAESP